MLLQQVRVIDPVLNTDQHYDVRLAGGVLQAMAASLTPEPEEVCLDARLWVLAPGLVDLYTQPGEPGFEQRETLASLTAAALAGGFTRVGILPTTQPAADQPLQLAYWRSRAKLWQPYALLAGTPLPELAELAPFAAAFCHNEPLPSWSVLSNVLSYVQPFGKPVLLWPQVASLAQAGVIYEGEVAAHLGLPSLPPAAETLAVAGIIEILRTLATPVHLMRLSLGRSVELVRTAQAQGLPLTASTTWQHLILTEQALPCFDPHLRLSPPLAATADRDALVEAVAAGSLTIAIDHQPYTYEEKQVPFAEAPAGAIGLELALPLLWQTWVATGRWSALQLWQALSQQPAAVLNLPAPQLSLGEPLEAVLFNPHQTWTVNATSLKSQSQATAWWNQTLTGQVLGTWNQGEWVGPPLA